MNAFNPFDASQTPPPPVPAAELEGLRSHQVLDLQIASLDRFLDLADAANNSDLTWPGRKAPRTTTPTVTAHVFNGDCLAVLPRLADGSVDLVLTDLPYGTTACAWDSIVPLDRMWAELKRVAKPGAAFVFTAQQPFTWALAASNPQDLRYELVWEKPNGTNPFNAKRQPMKKHENVLVFCERQTVYHPQMEEGTPYRWNSKRSKGQAGGNDKLANQVIDNPGLRYPGSVLRFKQERGLHPTQKPVELMEWLIRTYSNPRDRVLDFTMGSGTTGIAALRSGRSFVGIELDGGYFDIASQRLARFDPGEAANS